MRKPAFPLRAFYAGVVHRLVRRPSKPDRWVRFPSPAPLVLIQVFDTGLLIEIEAGSDIS